MYKQRIISDLGQLALIKVADNSYWTPQEVRQRKNNNEARIDEKDALRRRAQECIDNRDCEGLQSVYSQLARITGVAPSVYNKKLVQYAQQWGVDPGTLSTQAPVQRQQRSARDGRSSAKLAIRRQANECIANKDYNGLYNACKSMSKLTGVPMSVYEKRLGNYRQQWGSAGNVAAPQNAVQPQNTASAPAAPQQGQQPTTAMRAPSAPQPAQQPQQQQSQMVPPYPLSTNYLKPGYKNDNPEPSRVQQQFTVEGAPSSEVYADTDIIDGFTYNGAPGTRGQYKKMYARRLDKYKADFAALQNIKNPTVRRQVWSRLSRENVALNLMYRQVDPDGYAQRQGFENFAAFDKARSNFVKRMEEPIIQPYGDQSNTTSAPQSTSQQQSPLSEKEIIARGKQCVQNKDIDGVQKAFSELAVAQGKKPGYYDNYVNNYRSQWGKQVPAQGQQQPLAGNAPSTPSYEDQMEESLNRSISGQNVQKEPQLRRPTITNGQMQQQTMRQPGAPVQPQQDTRFRNRRGLPGTVSNQQPVQQPQFAPIQPNEPRMQDTVNNPYGPRQSEDEISAYNAGVNYAYANGQNLSPTQYATLAGQSAIPQVANNLSPKQRDMYSQGMNLAYNQMGYDASAGDNGPGGWKNITPNSQQDSMDR